MGVVYKAWHAPLRRVVAVKMILSGAHASDRQLARFQQEAETAAHLSHPNIVSVYEVGQHRGLAVHFARVCRRRLVVEDASRVPAFVRSGRPS